MTRLASSHSHRRSLVSAAVMSAALSKNYGESQAAIVHAAPVQGQKESSKFNVKTAIGAGSSDLGKSDLDMKKTAIGFAAALDTGVVSSYTASAHDQGAGRIDPFNLEGIVLGKTTGACVH